MQMLMGEGSYPGRIVGLGVACSDPPKPVALYAVSGRSEMSKRRQAVIRGHSVQIEPSGELTPEQEANKDLIIYRAMAVDPVSRSLVVSNGKQTDPIFDLVCRYGLSVYDATYAALYTMGYEPDRLCTPRLAGVFSLRDAHIERALGMVVANATEPSGKQVQVAMLDPIQPGKALLISTYTGDYDQPQAPTLETRDAWILEVDLESAGAEALAEELYAAINPAVRVAAVAAMLEPEGWTLAVKNLHNG